MAGPSRGAPILHRMQCFTCSPAASYGHNMIRRAHAVVVLLPRWHEVDLAAEVCHVNVCCSFNVFALN